MSTSKVNRSTHSGSPGISFSDEDFRDIISTHSGSPGISFSDEDFRDIIRDHNDPLVISAFIANSLVKRIVIYPGSAADILSWDAFKKLHLSDTDLKPFDGSLADFAGNLVGVKGYIELTTTIGEAPTLKTFNVKYLVVEMNSGYNCIFGRPTLHRLRAVVSTHHLALKFPTEDGEVGAVYGDQALARQLRVKYGDTIGAISIIPNSNMEQF